MWAAELPVRGWRLVDRVLQEVSQEGRIQEMRKPSSLTQAKEACRELIADMERRMYMSSYESECLAKLKIIRRGLNAARSKS